MNLSLSSSTSQLICPRHQIHLIHLLDTPFAGQNPIGIALTYVHLGKPSTLLVRPSAFRHVIQTLPPEAQKIRVSLNTFQFEFHADNLVDLNGFCIRLIPPSGSDSAELLEEAMQRLAGREASFTHYCYTAQELDLIWLTLPEHRPGTETLERYQSSYASCMQALADLHPMQENSLVATLPLAACSCAELPQSEPQHDVA